jgi:hypothetical protein
MLLFILIPIAWLSVLVLLVAICGTARSGDRRGRSYEEQSSIEIGPRIVLSGASTPPSPARRRTHAQRPLGANARIRRPRAGHVAR